MDPRSLRDHLIQITAHEKKYREGVPNPSLNKYNASSDNQDVLFFEFSKLVDTNSDSSIYIKKHSRFQTFPLHFHDYIEFNYMYSGSCSQIINNESHTLSKGQILLMDANTIHTIAPLGEEDILINIIIQKKYLTSNFFNRFSSGSVLITFFINAITDGMEHNNFLLFHSENSKRLQLFIEELLCEWYSPSIVFTDITENLLSLIISELVIVYKNEYTNNLNKPEIPMIIPILRHIEQNYKTCTLSEIARFFNLSPNYLSNLLKKHTGFSYKELIIEQRLKSAALLLTSSDKPVTEIASATGCDNISFFYKKFKEKFGVLPGEYRNSLQHRV